jgi:hypothetical protein
MISPLLFSNPSLTRISITQRSMSDEFHNKSGVIAIITPYQEVPVLCAGGLAPILICSFAEKYCLDGKS